MVVTRSRSTQGCTAGVSSKAFEKVRVARVKRKADIPDKGCNVPETKGKAKRFDGGLAESGVELSGVVRVESMIPKPYNVVRLGWGGSDLALRGQDQTNPDRYLGDERYRTVFIGVKDRWRTAVISDMDTGDEVEISSEELLSLGFSACTKVQATAGRVQVEIESDDWIATVTCKQLPGDSPHFGAQWLKDHGDYTLLYVPFDAQRLEDHGDYNLLCCVPYVLMGRGDRANEELGTSTLRIEKDGDAVLSRNGASVNMGAWAHFPKVFGGYCNLFEYREPRWELGNFLTHLTVECYRDSRPGKHPWDRDLATLKLVRSTKLMRERHPLEYNWDQLMSINSRTCLFEPSFTLTMDK